MKGANALTAVRSFVRMAVTGVMARCWGEGVRGRGEVLRVRWMVASRADGRAVAESTVERKVSADTWEAYAASHSAVFAVVARQIAEWVAALAAA